MRLNPPVPKDGCCALEGCGKPRQTSKHKWLQLHLDADPFCSARCAREFHGVVLSAPEQDDMVRETTEESKAWADKSSGGRRREKIAA